MATTSSPDPILFSVLSSSNDTNDDFINQLQKHLSRIETNFQQTLNKIHERKPFTSFVSNKNTNDSDIRNKFFLLLKDVAIKNNLQFDETFFRQHLLEKQDSSPKIDIARDKPTITIENNDQHLSPVNQTRRSQFAPVLSSTPVHQISPITPIPIDASMATPSAPPVLVVNTTNLPAVPPSAIVPQRANVGRPPRIPRGESVTRQKKAASPIKEQQEDIVIEEQIQITSKRRIKTKENIIEDRVDVVIEQQNEIISTDIIKQVQSTPLRNRKKKTIQDDANSMPQIELPLDNENPIKKSRTGRTKRKDEESVKPTRTASTRNRKKQEIEEKEISPSPKKHTRTRKVLESIPKDIEQNQPVAKVRQTPSRNKKKSSPIIDDIILIESPKKIIATTKSKKRKENEDTNENPVDSVQPPSPKRRGGRNLKQKTTSPIEPVVIETDNEPEPILTRTSRRGKKDIEIPILKQDDIVLNKKTRAGRGKKKLAAIDNENPIDVVMKPIEITASVSSSIDKFIAKPPRPPVARKKKSIAMPPLPQTSPSTPPSTQRIQPTSPVNENAILPLPIPTTNGRRRQQKRRLPETSPNQVEQKPLEDLPSTNRKQKRTPSSVAATPKRARRENLVVTSVLSTPGKKRNKCTCQKRRNKICDICAIATDA